MTKLEIIEETVAYYSEDTSRRGVIKTGGACDVSRCVYKTPNGNMCAVGRCIDWDLDLDVDQVNDSGSVEGLEGNFPKIDNILKPEYQGHELIFWQDLQSLHDAYYNWYENGLTEAGKKRVQYLKETYA